MCSYNTNSQRNKKIEINILYYINRYIMSFCHNVCEYCNSYHHDKKCPLEHLLAPYMKEIVGYFMEEHVAKEIYCPRCNNKALKSLRNHAPSLDIICTNCNSKYEVKSKCISAETIPHDLVFNHGNYKDYVNRQKTGLDFILIVYSVNRKTKTIKIRHMFYAKNEDIINNKCLNIVKKNNSSLSQIIVEDYNYLYEIIHNQKYYYDFSENITIILSAARKLYMDSN